jgi:hypothetical protein
VEAAVVAATLVTVRAISGGVAGCRGSDCRGPDRRSAIRIIPSAPSRATIGRPTIHAASIGHAAARDANSTATYTYRANASAANTGTTTTVGEHIVGHKGRTHKDGGCETDKNITQHLVFSFP